MEFLNAVGAQFSPEIVALLLVIVFVIVIYAAMSVRSAFVKTEKGKQLLQWWELVDDELEAIIVNIASTEQEREQAHKLAAHYSMELGRNLDWRMALALNKIEDFVDEYVPVPLRLVDIYMRAEHIYFQIQDELNSTDRKDVD